MHAALALGELLDGAAQSGDLVGLDDGRLRVAADGGGQDIGQADGAVRPLDLDDAVEMEHLGGLHARRGPPGAPRR